VRHARLVVRTWFVGVGMVVGWEWAEGVFDAFVRMVRGLLRLMIDQSY
jgi:hypothetical protein